MASAHTVVIGTATYFRPRLLTHPPPPPRVGSHGNTVVRHVSTSKKLAAAFHATTPRAHEAAASGRFFSREAGSHVSGFWLGVADARNVSIWSRLLKSDRRLQGSFAIPSKYSALYPPTRF